MDLTAPLLLFVFSVTYSIMYFKDKWDPFSNNKKDGT